MIGKVILPRNLSFTFLVLYMTVHSSSALEEQLAASRNEVEVAHHKENLLI